MMFVEVAIEKKGLRDSEPVIRASYFLDILKVSWKIKESVWRLEKGFEAVGTGDLKLEQET